MVTLDDRIMGSLLGGAIGDALGAPAECLHYPQIRDLFAAVKRFEDFTEQRIAEIIRLKGGCHPIGKVTDDTALADLLLDCILANDGQVTAYAFAREWERFALPVQGPDGEEVNRLAYCHHIEQIPYLRNQFREINKRDLGQGEANATNAIMYIAPVGLLCAGDPLQAELMAVDITAVNQHGGPRDVAGGYAAALAACFLPEISVDEIVRIGIEHTREYRHTREIRAIVDLARTCVTCEEFLDRYYQEIIGHLIPLRDLQHEDTSYSVTWNSSEILGPALAMFLITRGEDARTLLLACARMGRDCDTITRCAGGLIGAYQGTQALPSEWGEFVLVRNQWLRLEEKAQRLATLVRTRLQRSITLQQHLLTQG